MKEKKEKTPIKIGLVEWILILMACSAIALAAISYLMRTLDYILIFYFCIMSTIVLKKFKIYL